MLGGNVWPASLRGHFRTEERIGLDTVVKNGPLGPAEISASVIQPIAFRHTDRAISSRH